MDWVAPHLGDLDGVAESDVQHRAHHPPSLCAPGMKKREGQAACSGRHGVVKADPWNQRLLVPFDGHGRHVVPAPEKKEEKNRKKKGI